MVDPNDVEMKALETAEEFGRAYIKQLGRLRVDSKDNVIIGPLTFDEWKQLTQTVVDGYIATIMGANDSVQRAMAKIIHIPFSNGRVDAVLPPEPEPEK